MTNFILLIVVSVVFLVVVIAVLTTIVRKWPIMGFVFGAFLGVVVGFMFHWIAGVVVGLMTCGWLVSKAESMTKECSNCKSHDTELIKTDCADGKRIEIWKCNKCGQPTMFYEQ